MPTSQHICFDRILPRDLRRVSHPLATDAFRMAVLKSKKWPNASTLRISFLEGTAEQQSIVNQFAPEWCQFANLKFAFTNDSDAEIRIAFQDSDGAWSYIGTDCRDIPLDQPTMNLGWQDEGVVLHEFGHAIGLIHEHQNPKGGIKWNKPVVYRDLGGPPNNWPKAVVDNNMFKTYSIEQINGTVLDKESIMLYAIPKTWTTDGFESEPNDILSSTDKTFIGTEKNYPKAAAIRLDINAPAKEAEVGQPGEQDNFEFSVVEPAIYTVETEGPTDVMMSLYGPQSQTQPLAEDDDSGTDRNAKLTMPLERGNHRVQIRHFNSTGGTGRYKVAVKKAAPAEASEMRNYKKVA